MTTISKKRGLTTEQARRAGQNSALVRMSDLSIRRHASLTPVIAVRMTSEERQAIIAALSEIEADQAVAS